MKSRAFCLIAAILLSPGVATASSDAAWEALRQRLTEACTEAAENAAPEARIDIITNEYGTETAAIALVVTTRAGQEAELSVCLHDKRTGRTDLSAPFSEMPVLGAAGVGGP